MKAETKVIEVELLGFSSSILKYEDLKLEDDFSSPTLRV